MTNDTWATHTIDGVPCRVWKVYEGCKYISWVEGASGNLASEALLAKLTPIVKVGKATAPWVLCSDVPHPTDNTAFLAQYYNGGMAIVSYDYSSPNIVAWCHTPDPMVVPDEN